MMREGSMDVILDKMMKRKDKLSDSLTKQFKGEKPFAIDRLSPTAQIWAADNLGTEDMGELIQEYGEGAIGYALYQINKKRYDGRRIR